MPGKAVLSVKDSSSSNNDLLRNPALSEVSVTGEDAISPEAVRAELQNILATDPFRRSERSRCLLQVLVEHALDGRAKEFKEYSLAIDVLGRKPSFDPHVDPIVRVEVGRLRRKLNEYYENQGRESSLRIVVPLRRYAAVFQQRSGQPAVPAASPVAPAPEPYDPRKLLTAGSTLTLILLLVAIGGTVFWKDRQSAAIPVVPVAAASVAVLPFSDLSSGRKHAELAERITEETIEHLGHVQGTRVLSRSAGLPLKGKMGDVIEIGRRLGVTYILEGSVNRSGGRVSVIARLVNAADGYSLWSKSFVYEFHSGSPMEEEIAVTIADELRRQLGNREGLEVHAPQ